MPLYEYHCKRCDATFEVLQKFSDPPLSVHKGCGGSVERLLSPPALQFKGTGWYVTDYARNGKSGGSSPSVTTKNGHESGSKTETKPTASSDGKPAAAAKKT